MPLFYSFASTARQSARSALIELGCRMSADPAEAEGAEGSNASAASALHSRRYGACSAEAAASEAFGLSVGGCIRACRDFRPYPVGGRVVASDVCHTPHTATRERGVVLAGRGVSCRGGSACLVFRVSANMNSDACSTTDPTTDPELPASCRRHRSPCRLGVGTRGG